MAAIVEADPAQLNSRDDFGCTPLLLACELGNVEIAQWLLDHGAKLDAVDNDRRTPFFCAVESGNVELIKLLLQRGTSINELSSNFDVVLAVVKAGNVKMLRFLVNQVNQGGYIRDYDKYEGALLCAASMNGRIAILKFSLSMGCWIHSRDLEGYSAIMRAAEGGHIKTFKFLLRNGANPKDVALNGYTAFLLAAKNGHLEMIRYLLNNRLASPKERGKYGDNALIATIRGNHLNVVKFLMENGLCNPYEAYLGCNALHWAVSYGHLKIVNYLLAQDMKVGLKSSRGDTALNVAVERGNEAVVLMLIDHGANLCPKSASPVALVAENNDVGMLRVLGAMGANIRDGLRLPYNPAVEDWLRHVQHYSPMQIACEARRPDLIRRVLRRGGKAIEGLNVAMRHDADIPFSLPVCEATVALVKNASKWQPENHALFSDEMQQRVVNCLLVLEAINEDNEKRDEEELHLPNEVLYLMLKGFPRTCPNPDSNDFDNSNFDTEEDRCIEDGSEDSDNSSNGQDHNQEDSDSDQ